MDLAVLRMWGDWFQFPGKTQGVPVIEYSLANTMHTVNPHYHESLHNEFCI